MTSPDISIQVLDDFADLVNEVDLTEAVAAALVAGSAEDDASLTTPTGAWTSTQMCWPSPSPTRGTTTVRSARRSPEIRFSSFLRAKVSPSGK
jgi:hypothetical protein